MDPSTAALHTIATRSLQIAAFVMFTYDHVLTLGQEVERIWMRRISFAALLFLFNRYGTLIQFIVIVTAFNDPAWKGKSCARYVRFEASSTVGLVAVGEMIMILRVVALYNRSKKVFSFLLFLWTGQIIVSAIGLRGSFVLPLYPGLVGCIVTSRRSTFPSLWITPLVTDSVIFLLTLYRTRHNIGDLITLSLSGRAFAADGAATVVLRDGVIYYFFIFLANLMNALIFFLAQPDIKEIGASFSQLLTCTVISRLVLNLRSLSSDNQDTTVTAKTMSWHVMRPPYPPGADASKHMDTIWTRTLDDFTENDSATLQSEHTASRSAPLQQVEMTHHGNGHAHQEV